MSLLRVEGLTRRFGSLVAVNNVDFELHEGSVMGFVGPNGAGKSTAMRIIATLDVPDAGTVEVDGINILEDAARVRPLIGYMPDYYGTYAGLTVEEFLDFFARAYGLNGALRSERVASVVDFCHLEGLREKMTSALSKGMRQRVALARTLMHDPKLLILDEPADGLDPRARIELRELLKALAAQGKAVLISSHILSELSEICDSCIIIEQGKLLAHGKIEDVLRGEASVAQSTVRRFLVRLTTSAADELAVRTLHEQPYVKEVIAEPQGVRVQLDVPEEANANELAAAMIRSLVKAEVPVCGFEVPRVGLEDAFMHVTKGKVQ